MDQDLKKSSSSSNALEAAAYQVASANIITNEVYLQFTFSGCIFLST